MKAPDGTLNALEVLVFPEAARGSNEGHYPWDLQPESMMTNATVATVAAGADGQTLTLKYQDFEPRLTGSEPVVLPLNYPQAAPMRAGTGRPLDLATRALLASTPSAGRIPTLTPQRNFVAYRCRPLTRRGDT